ncbi:hypothetical protein PROFUN_12277 [Planoprotostelium fungivorum]|uniref:Thymidylate kinase n=1 Tax=Planoprotostelium fungivorum TaxID=1890364 RepID=A0A2P6N7R7_9EUKA|nr:hypothetical protein PROFUN_12277 [Planoprotostelium fungivorum]
MMKRGAIIVFEGIDRCGKSTQVQLLHDVLQKSRSVELMRFPNRQTPIGQKINSYLTDKAVQLDDHVIHLLFSANRWEARNQMLETIQSGKSIIVDRYAYSGVSFSAAKGLDLDWCKDPDRGLPAPDVVIYLQLSIEEAQKRGNYGEERYETVEFQRKVKDLYENKMKDPSWKVVNASQKPEDLHNDIRSIVESVIQDVEHTPLNTLTIEWFRLNRAGMGYGLRSAQT